jgi:hypothetical protein
MKHSGSQLSLVNQCFAVATESQSKVYGPIIASVAGSKLPCTVKEGRKIAVAQILSEGPS